MRNLILLLILLVAACAPNGYYATETASAPTPGENATPTQEAATWTPVPLPSDTPNPSNLWNLDCLTDEQGRTFFNPNPCLSGLITVNDHQVRPLRYDVVANDIPTDQAQCVDMWFDKGFTVNASQCSGEIGLAMPGVSLDDSCTMLVVRGDSTIHVAAGTEQQGYEAFYIHAVLYADNQIYDLGSQPVGVILTGPFGNPRYELAGQDLEFLFPFYFEALSTGAHLEVTFQANWGVGLPGSTFRFDSIVLVHPEDVGNCAGVIGF